MKKIIVLTRYDKLGASSRYRFYQILPFFKDREFSLKVSFLLSNYYLENLYYGTKLKSFLSIVHGYFSRLIVLLFSNKSDLIWLEKELFPWLPAFVEIIFLRLGSSYIIDYDDAIFHRYDQHRSALVRKLFGNKIKKVMRSATLVIAGNKYIADYAKKAGAELVEIIPTVVDHKKYNKAHQNRDGHFKIGWIGSPSTSRHLRVAKSALKQVCEDDSVKIITIGAQSTDVNDIPASVIPWSEETEAEHLSSFDVGIMPLPDTPWERGKCGFKLIQYMACGLPVVASPVGANIEIVKHGVDGFLADNTKEWIKYLMTLKGNPNLSLKMGIAGRKKVEREYSLQETASRLVELMKKVAEG